MLYLLRHLFSVLILPVTVTVVVPVWIARRTGVGMALPQSPGQIVAVVAGVVLTAIGFVLFAASLREFFAHGRGTLAPWDPPRRLVVRGPYRYVRNPMISGVVFLLFGTALCIRSAAHVYWAVAVLAINGVYIPLMEEPMLEDRFGADYRRYCRNVPRLVPRLTPWEPERDAG